MFTQCCHYVSNIFLRYCLTDWSFLNYLQIWQSYLYFRSDFNQLWGNWSWLSTLCTCLGYIQISRSWHFTFISFYFLFNVITATIFSNSQIQKNLWLRDLHKVFTVYWCGKYLQFLFYNMDFQNNLYHISNWNSMRSNN